eukprot:COSAG05_NODE_7853_length_763_cov_0.731928_1_plen_145_part_00
MVCDWVAGRAWLRAAIDTLLRGVFSWLATVDISSRAVSSQLECVVLTAETSCTSIRGNGAHSRTSNVQRWQGGGHRTAATSSRGLTGKREDFHLWAMKATSSRECYDDSNGLSELPLVYICEALLIVRLRIQAAAAGLWVIYCS